MHHLPELLPPADVEEKAGLDAGFAGEPGKVSFISSRGPGRALVSSIVSSRLFRTHRAFSLLPTASLKGKRRDQGGFLGPTWLSTVAVRTYLP